MPEVGGIRPGRGVDGGMRAHLTVVASKLADDAAGGDIPVEYLAITAAGAQLRVVPAATTTTSRTFL